MKIKYRFFINKKSYSQFGEDLIIKDLFGKSTLIEIFKIMKHCNLFIGNDSGLMHMAALANIKTFGLFGPSDKLKYKPWGKGNIAISIDRVKDNSNTFSSLFDDELKRVIIHGVLHFMGFNDKTDDEKSLIRKKEDSALEMFHVKQ